MEISQENVDTMPFLGQDPVMHKIFEYNKCPQVKYCKYIGC